MTEICTSTARRFPLVTFIDTPGLVDGDMQYAYDCDSALLWLGKSHYHLSYLLSYSGQQVEMIIVFFDPVGQALCKHTMDVVGGRQLAINLVELIPARIPQ